MSVLRRNALLTVVVSAALVVGVVSPAYAGGPIPPSSPDHSVSVSAVPPLPVPSQKTSGPDSAASGAGVPATGLVAVPPKPPVKLTDPVASGTAPDLSKSTVVGNDAFDTTYKNPDGSMTKHLSPTQINVKSGNGTWGPANTNLTTDSHTGGLSVVNNPLNPKFAPATGGGADFTVDSGTHPVSVSLQGAAAVSVTRPSAKTLGSLAQAAGTKVPATSSSLEYRNVHPGQDLQYQVGASEVKETLVLNSVPDVSVSSWTWVVHAPGLTMSKSVFGSYYLTDSTGTVEYNIPQPIMFDSSAVVGRSESAVVDVPTTFVQNSNSDWVMTLTPDRSWLTDPARVYPVSVDPSVLEGNTNVAAYLSDGVTSVTNGQNRIGNSRIGSNDTYWRTVACYNYEAVFGDEVLSTGTGVGADWNNGGTTTPYTGGFYAASSYSYNGAAIFLSNYTIGSSGTASDPSLIYEIQALVNQQAGGWCFMITGAETAGTYTYKDVTTGMWLNYEAKPTAVATSPTNNPRSSIMPTLAATSSDTSGAAQNFTFRVFSSTNPASTPVYTATTSGTTAASLQVGKGALTAGHSYWWDVTVADEYGATQSSFTGSTFTTAQEFSTNTPGVVSNTGATPADKAVVTSLTPTLTVPAAGTDANGDPLTYQFRVTTGTDGISGQVVSSKVFPVGTTFPLSWQVPAGILQDGTPYTWSVVVGDGYDNSVGWVNHFTLNQRITTDGPSPSDSAGPVTVNLGNGNVSASFTTPTVSTVGGAMGLSFNYDSEAASNAGLTGTYYAGTPTGGTSVKLTFPTTNPVVLQRTDSN